MANRRVERLNEQLRREISDILRRDVRDPRVGVPTVTRVDDHDQCVVEQATLFEVS